jgi:hypothetical protein
LRSYLFAADGFEICSFDVLALRNRSDNDVSVRYDSTKVSRFLDNNVAEIISRMRRAASAMGVLAGKQTGFEVMMSRMDFAILCAPPY